MSILTWLAGPYIDITPLDYPELYQNAACDKHRELVEAAQIAEFQRRIVERGGVVRNVAQHVERLEAKRK